RCSIPSSFTSLARGCGPFWLPPCVSFARPGAAELVQVEPDEKRLADDVLVRHEAPHPAVARIVPVVAHREVMARRNRARQAAHIVVAIPGMGERARRRDERRRVLLEQDLMLDAVERLEVTPRELHPLPG